MQRFAAILMVLGAAVAAIALSCRKLKRIPALRQGKGNFTCIGGKDGPTHIITAGTEGPVERHILFAHGGKALFHVAYAYLKWKRSILFEKRR